MLVFDWFKVQGHFEKKNFYPNVQDYFSISAVVSFKYPSEIGKMVAAEFLTFFSSPTASNATRPKIIKNGTF